MLNIECLFRSIIETKVSISIIIRPESYVSDYLIDGEESYLLELLLCQRNSCTVLFVRGCFEL